MAFLKLADPGEEMVIAVASVETVKGDFGMQVKLTNADGDILAVPEASITRQLDRIGVADVEDLAGRNIHVSRSKELSKNGKPYWNFDKAREGDVVQKPATNGKAVKAALLPNETGREDYLPQAPEDAATGFDMLVSKYAECMDAVTELLNARKATTTPEAYSAAVATLFIARNQAHV